MPIGSTKPRGADRKAHDAFMAAAAIITAVRRCGKPAQKRARQTDGPKIGPGSGPDIGGKSMSRQCDVIMTPEVLHAFEQMPRMPRPSQHDGLDVPTLRRPL
jgi:hypothetical protein